MEGTREKTEEAVNTKLPETVSKKSLREAARIIAHAKRIVVFSGAGISAESGIATFRAPDIGIWANKIGLVYFGTPFGWWATPGLAWRAYLTYFRDPIARAKPNPGHYAIAALQHIQQDTKQAQFSIVTQNVDGLHQRAGNSDDVVFEVHGTVYRHRCSKNHHLHPYIIDPSTLDKEGYDPEKDEFFSHDSSKFPRCQEKGCNSYLRPDAVLFTEGIPDEDWSNSYQAVHELGEGDCMIVVGTSGVVYPAASLPEMACNKKRRATVIEVNPEPSALTDSVHIFLQGPSGVVLPALVKKVKRIVKRERKQTDGKEKKRHSKEEERLDDHKEEEKEHKQRKKKAHGGEKEKEERPEKEETEAQEQRQEDD